MQKRAHRKQRCAQTVGIEALSRRDTSCGELHFRQSYRTMTMTVIRIKDIMQIEFRQGVFYKEYWTFWQKPVMISDSDVF